MSTTSGMPINAYARALNGPQVAFEAALDMLDQFEGARMSRTRMLPESMQARLRILILEALKTQAAGEGITSLPHSIEQAVTGRALGDLMRVPVHELSTFSVTSSPLVSAVQSGFNTVLTELTPAQRERLKQGLDPYDHASLRAGGHAELLAGAAAVAGSSMRFANLPCREGSGTASQQFADLDLPVSTANSFAAIGLDRTLYDQYRGQGLTRAQIAATARDAQALGFKGRDDIDIAMHAPDDLRSAAAAVAKAKTPEQKIAARKRYDDAVKKYDQLPDNDSRKANAQRFIKRVNDRATAKIHELGQQKVRDMSTSEQARIAGLDGGKVKARSEARDAMRAQAQAVSDTDDGWGVTADASPANGKANDKPAEIRTADASASPASKEPNRLGAPTSASSDDQRKTAAKTAQVAPAKPQAPVA